jgi:hypothetical protein
MSFIEAACRPHRKRRTNGPFRAYRLEFAGFSIDVTDLTTRTILKFVCESGTTLTNCEVVPADKG